MLLAAASTTISLEVETMKNLVVAGLGVATLLACFAEAGHAVQASRSGGPPRNRLAYQWPVKPFDRPHPIRGAFGDPRTVTEEQPFGLTGPDKAGAYSFHNGVDIVAEAGQPAFPVVSGRVIVADKGKIVVLTADGRSFQYSHLTGAVHRGQHVVAKRTILGWIQARYGHVHLAEIDLFRVHNPLDAGHLGPYVDRTRPAAVGLYVDDGHGARPFAGPWLDPHERLAVSAADPQPSPVPAPWLGLPHVPALVQWRLFHDGRRTPWQVVADFRKTQPPARSFWAVYAPGTYQNSPVFDHHLYLGNSGLYLFRVGLKPDHLPPGSYRLEVRVSDVRQNHSTSSWRLQVPPPNKVRRTTQPIWTLAMDGPRLAYMSDGRVRVWNVSSGATSTIGGDYGRGAFGEVAIAGKRVALITRSKTNHSEQTTERLYIASLGGRAHQLASASRRTSTADGSVSGGSITGLVGSGNVLAVSTWKSNGATYSHRRLSLLALNGLRPIATGPNAIVSKSAADPNIAVLRSLPQTSAPTVGVYSAAGRLLREITRESGIEIALSGDRLVVLTRAATLEVYDWTTGTLLHTWPVPAKIQTSSQEGGSNLAVYRRFAVVTGARRLHLLDLNTGKDVVIAAAADSRYNNRNAAIGPSGLVYAADSSPKARPPRGKLVFVPTNKLLALLSR